MVTILDNPGKRNVGSKVLLAFKFKVTGKPKLIS
jgi:hypothetical protein